MAMWMFKTSLIAIALLVLSFFHIQGMAQQGEVKRSDFPNDFVFGVSTAAAQIEGSNRKDGKGPSVWDKFVQRYPKKIKDGTGEDFGIDSYKRYKEDVLLVKDLGVDAYRFSISWTRILPNGALSGGINQKGVDHYSSLIDELVKYNITPYVTLLHFDSPQILEEKYGGFLNRTMVDDFKDYADFCFKTFGDRVRNWITINEPYITAKMGYDLGVSPPGRCSDKSSCYAGNSSTEPYIGSHNMLLAHATAVKLYRDKYQATQHGKLGLALVGDFFEPYSNSEADEAAAKRAMEFSMGWYLGPLVYGDYPEVMRKIVKDRLPTFTEAEKALVKGSFDFVGINFYTGRYARGLTINPNDKPVSYSADRYINETHERNGMNIGPQASGSDFVYIYPVALRKLVRFLNENYQKPTIIITENGVTQARNDSLPAAAFLEDQFRIDFVRQHLSEIRELIKSGFQVKGYFYWNLMDDFEWNEGYIPRFGLYYVDYKDNLKRTPKKSAKWYHDFIKGQSS